MAIFRCSKCGYLREVPNEYTGKSTSCPVCQELMPIYDTIDFIKKVVQKYVNLYKELQELKQQIPSVSKFTGIPDESAGNAEINIYNTTNMMKVDQFEPILQWFRRKQIQVDVNEKAVDTTGFFDEVAVKLGDNYELLKEVSDRIKRAQAKGYTNIALNLSKYSQKEVKCITDFCQELYQYSFLAKYYNKEGRVQLSLQTAPAIVKFFNGEWLEWFVFMKLFALCHEKKLSYSCLRNFTINFPNEDKHELDVFFLLDGSIPLCLECKSGEFRSSIDKYSRLRRRLGIDKTYFLFLVVGLSNEQVQGLTSMFDLTFVNERTFLSHVTALFT